MEAGGEAAEGGEEGTPLEGRVAHRELARSEGAQDVAGLDTVREMAADEPLASRRRALGGDEERLRAVDAGGAQRDRGDEAARREAATEAPAQPRAQGAQRETP